MKILNYWKEKGKTIKDQQKGKIWKYQDIEMCDECCNKDRETDCDCYHRPKCPYCLGAGLFQ